MLSSLVFRAGAALLVALAAAPVAAPVAAKTPPKPTGGPDTALVSIGTGDAATRAFVAWPASPEGAPCIVVCHEWWGLNDQIRGMAKKLAREGYVAVVPDLYHGQVATDPEVAHELSRALEQEGAYRDLDAAVDWIRAQPRTAKSKLATLGFCMGGGLSQGLALRRPDLSAAVMFYGGAVTDTTELRKMTAPLLAHFGALDKGIPPSRAGELRKGLKDTGKTGEVYVYPGAGHGFMNETRPAYHADAARQAWARTLAFLQRYLKG